MIGGCKVLGVVTARGGSKGVSRKNIRMVGGKPLLAWTIETAKHSQYLDRLVISTDDEAIMEMALRYGCEVPFKRAPQLASDEASSVDVILDVLDHLPGYDYVVLLQPTSPLRNAADIDNALEICERAGAPACVTVCAVAKSPYWMFTLGSNNSLQPLLPGKTPARRQDLPPVYALNGAVYVAKVQSMQMEKTFLMPGAVACEMPLERSLDVDTEADFKLLDSYLE